MEPNVITSQASQDPFNLNNIKIVDNNHDADWITKMNNPIEPAILINGQHYSNGTIQLKTDQHPSGTDVKISVKPCGLFVRSQGTTIGPKPSNYTVQKHTGFSESASVDNNFRLGKRAYYPWDFECKFKFIRKFDFQGSVSFESTTTYTQHISINYYIHQSLITYAYKMVDSYDHNRIVALNPDFNWKFIGNDLYFFVSMYSNDQILRSYDSKYQMVDEKQFIDFLSTHRNLWDN